MSIFYLPDLGEGLSEAEIVEWHVAEGDKIQRGQLLVSVETAKAVVEVPSPQAGQILKLFAKAGDIVPTGEALVEFAASSAKTTKPAAAKAPPTKRVPAPKPAPAAEPVVASSTEPAPTSEPPAQREDKGSVVGTLSQAETQSDDSFIIGRHRHTEARLQQRRQKLLPRERLHEHQHSSTTPAEPVSSFSFEGEALHGLRRHMAQTMATSHREVALVTLHDEVRIRWYGEQKPLLRLIQALAYAARQEPALNAWYDDARKVRLLHESVHLGIAVDTKAGLLVPVLKDVQRLDEAALTRRFNKLKVAAVKRQLAPEDMQGATLTLSVFGSIGGRFATPLVTPPQVAILAAGRIYEGVVATKKGGVKSATLLPLSLSVDHRAVTGGEAARFLAAVVSHLADEVDHEGAAS